MHDLVQMIKTVKQDRHSGKVPTNPKDLLIWSRKYAPEWVNSNPLIDWPHRQIVDTWGNEIRLIVENGKVKGLVSAGPDGKFEEKFNFDDDINVRMDTDKGKNGKE